MTYKTAQEINARYLVATRALSSSDDPEDEDNPGLKVVLVAHLESLVENARATLLAAGITPELLEEARAVRAEQEDGRVLNTE